MKKFGDLEKRGLSVRDAVRSVGNEFLGHRIKDKWSRWKDGWKYWKGKDIYFQDFMDEFLGVKLGSLRSDLSPMENLYQNLKLSGQSAKVAKNSAEIEVEEKYRSAERRDTPIERQWIKSSRWKRLQGQCNYQVVTKAMKIFEENFGYLRTRELIS